LKSIFHYFNALSVLNYFGILEWLTKITQNYSLKRLRQIPRFGMLVDKILVMQRARLIGRIAAYKIG